MDFNPPESPGGQPFGSARRAITHPNRASVDLKFRENHASNIARPSAKNHSPTTNSHYRATPRSRHTYGDANAPSSPRFPESPRDMRNSRPTHSTVPSSSTTGNNIQNRNTVTKQRQISHSTRHSNSPDSSPMRQPMDFKAAFKLAEKQIAHEDSADEQVAHEDSSDDTLSMRQAFNIASAEMNGARVDGSPSPAPRPFRRESLIPVPQRTPTHAKDTDLGKHLQQFDRNHNLGAGNGPVSGLFTRNFPKNPVGSQASHTGNTPAKKASGGSLSDGPEYRRRGQWEGSPAKKENLRPTTTNGDPVDRPNQDIPVPTIEYEPASHDRYSPFKQHPNLSPEKSYNWHLDADFTGSDLQVSASPRVKIDGTRELSPPVSPGKDDLSVADTPNFKRSNTRLDQIRAREVEAAKAYPTFTPSPTPSPDKPRLSKLEEIQAREAEAFSRRAIASSRLDEIRLRNSQARSESPETRRQPAQEDPRGSLFDVTDGSAALSKNNSDPELGGRHIRETPVKAPQEETMDRKSKGKDAADQSPRAETPGVYARDDSHELLDRLARATSSSPIGDSPAKIEEPPATRSASPKPASPELDGGRSRFPREGKLSRLLLGSKYSRERPTVGFAGLKAPTDPAHGKRDSKPTSEVDPTDRIEAEMLLFETQSDRSSKRAPSPVPPAPKADEEMETPRPTKPDPMTQPTPRVTGAYVETPNTVKVKVEEPNTKQGTLRGSIVQNVEKRDAVQNRERSKSLSESDASDTTKAATRGKSRSSSAPSTSRRRVRSTSRRRRPLVNTAKPASVRDDIRSILQMNEIDDSTLDDFDSILANHEIDDEELERMMNESMAKIGDEFNFPGDTDLDRELQAYDRMSKSLQTGLLGIRSAKKGIERLEDKVAHTEQKGSKASVDTEWPSSKAVGQAAAETIGPGPFSVSVPRLYRKDPKFRLTTFGLLTLLLSVWYALELGFSTLFAVPETECTPHLPCDWSPNEPYFPYTMPFMLDEWATGGKGREFVLRIGEEIGDLAADASDWMTNTDFTQYDQQYMNVWERKRHRRRLRKHGLVPKWTEPVGYQPRFPEWQARQLAREAAEEYGYEEDEEMISADERIW
ncbi:hypothetical protein F4780DRAFT_608357 [Xylariomycetidae sp. FL0641]|nr:hypothetical protein F4780DRAFT_608357 [Xylariomycetidae sp. FL0641]